MTTPSSNDDRRLRYLVVSRRAAIARGVTAATAAALLGLAGCSASSSNDAGVLSAATSTTVVSSSQATTGDSSTTATDSSTTEASTGATASGEVTIAFTYSASSGGQVHNPYLAAWVEDADGNLVDTLAVWYEQSQKGTRWLNELTTWAQADGSSDSLDAVSGATRTPGDQSLVWDLTDLDGNAVEEGTYTVFVETAREHGPHSLISQEIPVGSSATTVTLSSEGELTGGTVAFTPA
ncbi:MAG: DUF2271 domain-containing protein [Actinobacteria bacterium]|nr:DUF2271 domain-containing protein [Actinomycetota bacterium]